MLINRIRLSGRAGIPLQPTRRRAADRYSSAGACGSSSATPAAARQRPRRGARRRRSRASTRTTQAAARRQDGGNANAGSGARCLAQPPRRVEREVREDRVGARALASPVSASSTHARSSSQPVCAAAFSIAYSPTTWYTAVGAPNVVLHAAHDVEIGQARLDHHHVRAFLRGRATTSHSASSLFAGSIWYVYLSPPPRLRRGAHRIAERPVEATTRTSPNRRGCACG